MTEPVLSPPPILTNGGVFQSVEHAAELITQQQAPQRRAFVGGWLSMAPSTEEAKAPIGEPAPKPAPQGYKCGHEDCDCEKSSSSSAGSSSVGSDEDEDMVGTTMLVPPSILSQQQRQRSGSDASMSSASSRGSADSMTGAAFDFRKSMVPLVFSGGRTHGKRAQGSSSPGSVASDGRAFVSLNADSSPPAGKRRRHRKAKGNRRGSASTGYVASTPGGTNHVVNGGGGLKHSGIEWSGKTLHAVEQEMEQVGNPEWMSHAPDPQYLASRLEAVRRNLEIEESEGGSKKKRWLSWSDEDASPGSPLSQRISPAAKVTMVEEPQTLEAKMEQNAPVALEVTSPESSPVASTPSDFYGTSPAVPLRPPAMLNREAGRAPPPTTVDAPINVALRAQAKGKAPPLLSQEKVAELSAALQPVDHQSQMQALEQRISIRDIRRSDLEQVRDLHCLHGDERLLGLDEDDDVRAINFDTYTTSATFLLRLLVDENHISVVAVAKPLPVPEPFPGGNAAFSRIREDLHETSSRETSRERTRTTTLQQEPDSEAASPLNALAASMSISDDARAPPEQTESNVTSDSEEPGRGSLFSTSPADPRPEITPATSILENSPPPNMLPTQYATMKMKIDTPAIPQLALEGPEFIAPPPAKRVMAVAPLKGQVLESETILGVASATVTYRHRTPESLWPDPSINICGPEELDRSECSTIHILTLSILPAERSQGLGGKLLDELLERAKARLRMQHLIARRRRAAASARSESEGGQGKPLVKVSEDDTPKMRAYLEVHPSNTRAIELYQRKGFTKPEGSSGIKKGFYRGDERIPSRIRLHPGGRDAWVYERWL